MGLFASRETGLRWFGVVWWWFGGGLGLTWQVYVIKMLLNSFFKSSYYHKNIYWVLRKWFGVVKMWFGGGLGCFGVVWGVSTDRKIGLYLEVISMHFKVFS